MAFPHLSACLLYGSFASQARAAAGASDEEEDEKDDNDDEEEEEEEEEEEDEAMLGGSLLVRPQQLNSLTVTRRSVNGRLYWPL
jgi:TATA-binding protein-associated factor Taf7